MTHLAEVLILRNRQAYIFDPKDGGIGLTQLDVSDASGFTNNFTAAYADPKTDVLYFIMSPNQLASWDTGTNQLQYRWKSKVYMMPYPTSLEAAEVRASDFGAGLTLKLYGDGTQFFSKNVTSDGEFVVAPAVPKEVQIELTGTATVKVVEASNDMEELS